MLAGTFPLSKECALVWSAAVLGQDLVHLLSGW